MAVLRLWKKLLNHDTADKCRRKIQNLNETKNLEASEDFEKVETDNDKSELLELLRRVPGCSKVLE